MNLDIETNKGIFLILVLLSLITIRMFSESLRHDKIQKEIRHIKDRTDYLRVIALSIRDELNELKKKR